MGKVIRVQRLGKGARRGVPSHRFKGDIRHLPTNDKRVSGKIIDIVHAPGITAPLAKIKYDDNTSGYMIAPLQLGIGDDIKMGSQAKTITGCTLALTNIPEGSFIYNVESVPGDGGKFVRSSGTFAKLVTHNEETSVVQLPSGIFKTLNSKCRATIGTVAGGGRTEKPFVKAGNRRKALRSRGRLYPIVCGVNMNPKDHPFGGGNHPHTGKPKTISRNAPPGRKVGSISARKTGKKR